MIEVKNLTQKDGKRVILNNLNLTVKEGEVLGILGEKNTGKTVLMDIIMGFISPSAGEVLVNGKPILKNLLEIRKIIGSSTKPDIFANMKVRELLNMLAENRKIENVDEVVSKISDIFDIKDILDTKISRLNNTDKSKVSTLSAYISKPEIVLLDAPFSKDEDVINMVVEIINKVKKDYTTIVASQNAKAIEKVADRVLILKNGECQLEVDIKKLDRPLEEVYNNFKCEKC